MLPITNYYALDSWFERVDCRVIILKFCNQFVRCQLHVAQLLGLEILDFLKFACMRNIPVV